MIFDKVKRNYLFSLQKNFVVARLPLSHAKVSVHHFALIKIDGVFRDKINKFKFPELRK